MALIGNIIVIIFITYYTLYFFRLLMPKQRQVIQATNTAMDDLRAKPVKTLEEQKMFLNIKYPKRGKFKLSWQVVWGLTKNIIIFVLIYQAFSLLFGLGNIEFKIWQGILFVMVAPIIINILLEKFNLQKSDMRQFLRWK